MIAPAHVTTSLDARRRRGGSPISLRGGSRLRGGDVLAGHRRAVAVVDLLQVPGAVVPAVLDVPVYVAVREVLLVVVHAHEQVARGRRAVGSNVLTCHRGAAAAVDLLQVPVARGPVVPAVLDVAVGVDVGEEW